MTANLSAFEQASARRKHLVAENQVPDWYTTQGLIMFERKYSFQGETVKGAFRRVADTLGAHYSSDPEMAKNKFFDIMWKGFLAPSTPVICNTGTGRGLPVSCAGSYFPDSISGFYKGHAENAMLSKLGFGTSSYLGDIRPRGATISAGGEADGAVPVLDSAIDVMNKVSQGSSRRGQWAGYIDMHHGDFWELAGYVQKNPVDTNIGYNFTAEFIRRLGEGNPAAIARFNKVMYNRCRTGKGYIWKPDTANRLSPEAIKNSGISIKASNLCVEIALPQDEDHTFTCVLSSLNLAKWDSFEDDTIFWALIFLDCVTTEMLNLSRHIPELEKATRFTEKARALGLGALGFHSLLQSKSLAIEGFEAHMLNNQIFSKIQSECKNASQHLAREFGEPEWCKGTGYRNATFTAVAPNMSSALLCGGSSQGIEPLVANAFNQNTAAGEMTRMNPNLVNLLKEKGEFSYELMDDIAINHSGSVQHLECLTDHQKMVYRTAFEVDQRALLRLASIRQKYICQGQSLNLFFSADEEEAYIAEIHKEALLDPNIKGLYYLRSERGIKASKNECVACEG